MVLNGGAWVQGPGLRSWLSWRWHVDTGLATLPIASHERLERLTVALSHPASRVRYIRQSDSPVGHYCATSSSITEVPADPFPDSHCHVSVNRNRPSGKTDGTDRHCPSMNSPFWFRW